MKSKAAWFSLGVIFILALTAMLAPWLAPHDPYRYNLTYKRLPPVWVQDEALPGMAEYPLGTDQFGRDILSRLLYGTRTAFFLAFTAIPLAALIGTLAGLSAGYFGGRVDAWIMYITDLIQSLPGIMFMVIVVLLFRTAFPPSWLQGVITLVVGFAAVSWASLARLVRVNVLLLKSQLFIESAVALGSSPWQIIFKHLLPNIRHVVLVWIINNIPAVILLEAMLGYIGIGVTSAVDGDEFTVVSWGGMFFSGRAALSRNPFMLMIPSLCVLLISMSFILLADYLNETNRHNT